MLEPDYRPSLSPLVAPGDAELHVSDMTATFSAGMTLAEAQRRLSAHAQWLAIDGPADATLGALVDRNSTGPLRLGFGGWRDVLLGAQFVNGNDELITAGGRTVKNVAGYDLTKFMVGQRGTFGRLVTITMRTYRLPDAALLVEHEPRYATLLAMMPTPMRPQWTLLNRTALYCGYLGDEPTIDWYRSNAGHPTSPGPKNIERRSLAEDTAQRLTLLSVGNTNGRSFRAAVPPARVEDLTSDLPTDEWIIDPAFGIAIGQWSEPAQRQAIEAAAGRLGGSASFTDSDRFEFSTTPVQRQIIERLKRAFDPGGKFNPLPWQTH